jgi:hypothetical protein
LSPWRRSGHALRRMSCSAICEANCYGTSARATRCRSRPEPGARWVVPTRPHLCAAVETAGDDQCGDRLWRAFTSGSRKDLRGASAFLTRDTTCPTLKTTTWSLLLRMQRGHGWRVAASRRGAKLDPTRDGWRRPAFDRGGASLRRRRQSRNARKAGMRRTIASIRGAPQPRRSRWRRAMVRSSPAVRHGTGAAWHSSVHCDSATSGLSVVAQNS